jgi:ABC-2 type transport system ATP-binding protein
VTDPSAVDTEPDRPRPSASSEPERPAIELDAPATSAPPGAALEHDAAVFVENAVVRFADQVAVDGISLVVPPGTILGLIGPSGSGKTTTIRVLTGALKPTSGTFRVLGEEPGRFRRETRERIGYMPQSFTLYRDLTVRENVDLIGSLFGMFFFERRRRTREVLETVDLWSVRGRRAGKLSGGMQRRLELACALVHDPDLMFLDEPTAGIDPLLRTRVWDELHRLRDSGRTLLVTTQYLNEAEACDHVALITEGQLVALATPSELRRQAAGGDIIEIETASRFDGLELESLPFIRHVRQDGPRNLRLTVDDAGTATPDVVDAITTKGGEVAFAREIRASFDDVFATLVARHRARTAEAGEDEPDPDTWPGGPLAAPSESGSDRGESAA